MCIDQGGKTPSVHLEQRGKKNKWKKTMPVVPFDKDFSPNGEQPEQHELARPAPARNTWYQLGPVENENIASHTHDKYNLYYSLMPKIKLYP